MNDTLEHHAAAWRWAKEQEDAARALRLSIEEKIAAAIPSASDEGTQHALLRSYKITVTRKLTRSIEGAALQAAWESIGALARRAVRWEAGLDLKAYKQLDDESRKQLDRYITSKPAKPSVRVEERDDGL